MTVLRDVLAEIGDDCDRCSLGGNGKLVFGSGPPNARYVLVGEGPGAQEAARGLPFVGRAGLELNRLLASVGISRGECYVANVVKHRPPANRRPTPDEIEACLPFLKRQIRAVNPRVMILFGATAADAFMRDTSGYLYDIPFDWGGIPTLATYHPAYVARCPTVAPQVMRTLALAKSIAEKGAER